MYPFCGVSGLGSDPGTRAFTNFALRVTWPAYLMLHASFLLSVPHFLPHHPMYGRNIVFSGEQVLKKALSFGKVFPKPCRSTENDGHCTGVV